MQNNLIVLVLLFFQCVAIADAPPLTQPEMQQVLRALQTQFADSDATGFTALNRAAIAGLLRDNPQTMQLLTVPDAAPAAPPPLLQASLTPRIACIRPGSFRQEDTTLLRDALTKLAAGETAALILDLRAPAADTDPAIAADLAALFLPKGTPLFTFKTPLQTTADPVWTRELLVLADSDTPNTAEILATVLQAPKRALLIGGPTRGRTASVADLPLRKTDAGQIVLRYTPTRVTFADKTDPFGKGLTPDFPAPQEAGAKQAVFALQTTEGLARGVFQTARPRVSEASLLARSNPEIPDRIARASGKPSGFDAQPTDRPLQLAVDILIARQALAEP